LVRVEAVGARVAAAWPDRSRLGEPVEAAKFALRRASTRIDALDAEIAVEPPVSACPPAE